MCVSIADNSSCMNIIASALSKKKKGGLPFEMKFSQVCFIVLLGHRLVFVNIMQICRTINIKIYSKSLKVSLEYNVYTFWENSKKYLNAESMHVSRGESGYQPNFWPQHLRTQNNPQKSEKRFHAGIVSQNKMPSNIFISIQMEFFLKIVYTLNCC